MNLPKRILVILEGEGLANDATALILYRFAVTAVSAGVFSAGSAVGTFACIVVGEVLWGIGVGWFMLRVRRWVDDPRVEIMLSILTPFIAFWPASHLGGSGVLATVTAGLYISWNGIELISAATRLQGIFFWDFLIYLIEGLVFLITGLQARTLIPLISGTALSESVLAAVVVSIAVVATRFIWIFPATYVPRWLSARVRKNDPAPPWQWPFALGYTGVRGIVSLAAAIAIPLTTDDGQPFPNRALIIFLVFLVILVTLVGQGSFLPLVIRWLGLANAGRRERHASRAEEAVAWRKAIEAALERLAQLAKERKLPEELLRSLHARYRDRLSSVDHLTLDDEKHRRGLELSEEICLQLIETERRLINGLYREGLLEDDARRRMERELDLRVAEIDNLQIEE